MSRLSFTDSLSFQEIEQYAEIPAETGLVHLALLG